jgi:hypothetical protein
VHEKSHPTQTGHTIAAPYFPTFASISQPCRHPCPNNECPDTVCLHCTLSDANKGGKLKDSAEIDPRIGCRTIVAPFCLGFPSVQTPLSQHQSTQHNCPDTVAPKPFAPHYTLSDANGGGKLKYSADFHPRIGCPTCSSCLARASAAASFRAASPARCRASASARSCSLRRASLTCVTKGSDADSSVATQSEQREACPLHRAPCADLRLSNCVLDWTRPREH